MSCWSFLHDDLTIMEIALLVEDVNEYHGKDLHNYSLEWGDNENGIDEASDALGVFADSPISHIYFGSEFCEYRFPSVIQFWSFMTLCKTEGLSPTLVTPPVTDYGIGRISALLDEIEKNNLSLDIVVNDVGVMQLIYERKVKCSIILGRVFDKMSHDSRASAQRFDMYYGNEGRKFATTPGVISNSAKKLYSYYNVGRYEFDLPRVGINIPNDGGKYSLYWPYSYLTTGRVCFFRSTILEGRNKFLVGDNPCSMPCKEYRIQKFGYLDSTGKQYLFQKGNTIFYINDGREVEKYFDMFDRIVLQV